MIKENGNEKQPTKVSETKVNLSTKPFSLYSQIKQNEKKDKNEITIEDILENDDYFNDLKLNPKSLYKKLLIQGNIKKLILYCLQPIKDSKEISKKYLRYPYYSSLILCSELVLLFSSSIKHIKGSKNEDNIENKKKNKHEEEKEKENRKKNQDISSLEKKYEEYEVEKEDKIVDINTNMIENIQSEEIYEDRSQDLFNEQEEKNYEDFFQFRDDFDNDERYVQITETEIKKKTISKKGITEYDAEERKIINDILNEIFKYLDFNYQEDQTCMGYFQKIINYMLYCESKIIIDYLFKEPNFQIKKLYKHLDKFAIQNILENLLNILADKEDTKIDIKDSKYNNIIQDILQELANDVKYEKAESTCELIINTLINNSEKQFIELIFNDENIISKLRTFIEVIINKESFKKDQNKEHFDKTIIGIIQILCQLNNIIMSSLSESEYYQKNNYYKIFMININKKINTFEYQYISEKYISIIKIFKAYENKIDIFLKEINYIFNIIKEDILIKYKKYKENKKNNNNKNNNFGLRHLYEWKFIVNALKLYIFSFYAVENLNSDHYLNYFADKKLFKILIKYYFNFQKNNIYQNICIEIIKLICCEKCPGNIATVFLNGINLNKFINTIMEKSKEEINNKNNKYNLSLGANIEILNIFYSSNNPYILKFLSEYQICNIYKDIFNDYMKPKLERKLLDEWDYSNSEIFNSKNENNDTFDGNDIDIKRQYDPFTKIVIHFLEKCKKNNKIKEQIKTKQNDKSYEVNHSINTIKESKNFFENKEEKQFSTKMELKIELEDKQIYDEIISNT